MDTEQIGCSFLSTIRDWTRFAFVIRELDENTAVCPLLFIQQNAHLSYSRVQRQTGHDPAHNGPPAFEQCGVAS